ncbi:MAG: ribonuclease HII [Chloroflexi bacterium]|nr:ribonuclease HII [Chloroflexota bacterium]
MRTDPDLTFEQNLWQSGFQAIAGLDEAGRGALAGPVAVGAVILPNDTPLLSTLKRVRDSKQMTPLARDSASARIKEVTRLYAVGFSSVDEIDSLGIVAATRLAALRALETLSIVPDYLLTDFRLELPELDISQTALVKGDAHCLSIACASVLAKTARDALMRGLDAEHPGYQLGKHKGYGTQAHRLALKRLGYSSIHRKTFSFKK